MNELPKDKVYFPNLDGLRFIGALLILILHIEGYKVDHSKEIIGFIYYFYPLGGLAVSLFFVLSGFLITYLLLKEKQNTSPIQLKKFYVKRMLKIWPLYFLIGIIGFFLLPRLGYYSYSNTSDHTYINFGLKALLYFLFLLPFSKSESMGPAWSVRVEEAFYLIWPVLLRYNKSYIKLCVYTVIFIILIHNISAYFAVENPLPVVRLIAHIINNYRVSCMAIGGLGAYLYIEDNQKILSLIYRKDMQYVVYGITAILLAFKVHIPFVYFEAYSVLFTCIVVNLATNPKSIVKLDYKWMNYLGKISYGIYLYNSITRVYCFKFVEYTFGKPLSGWQMEVVLYASVIISTLVVATLSYEYFEKPFLKLKNRFEVILSRN